MGLEHPGAEKPASFGNVKGIPQARTISQAYHARIAGVSEADCGHAAFDDRSTFVRSVGGMPIFVANFSSCPTAMTISAQLVWVLRLSSNWSLLCTTEEGGKGEDDDNGEYGRG